MNRFAALAVAATAVVVAILIGIGILVRPPDVGPSPMPGPTHSATAAPSATPAGSASSAAAWTATGSMIEARRASHGDAAGRRKVLCGGVAAYASAELYDPVGGTWTATGNMVRPFRSRGHAAEGWQGAGGRRRHGRLRGAVRPGQWYLGRHRQHGQHLVPRLHRDATGGWQGARGGCGAAARTSIRPRPSCTTRPAGPGRPLGRWSRPVSITQPRCWTMAGCWWQAARGGKGYLASAEVYDPASGTWTATGDMAVGRGDFTASLLADGNVLVVGGLNHNGGGVEWASAELYDPVSGSWTATGNMGEARYGQGPPYCAMAECSSPAAPTPTSAAQWPTRHCRAVRPQPRVLESRPRTWAKPAQVARPRSWPMARSL